MNIAHGYPMRSRKQPCTGCGNVQPMDSALKTIFFVGGDTKPKPTHSAHQVGEGKTGNDKDVPCDEKEGEITPSLQRPSGQQRP
jgi:hypothetical protein